ncbi:extracellular solute-binding protein [Pseudomonas putida]
MLKGSAGCVWLLLCCAQAAQAQPQTALTVYGEAAKYPSGFQHFDYVNPQAPKGGRFSLSGQTAPFDHLVPYVDSGQGVDKLNGWLYAPLAYRSKDEPYTVYGDVAQTMEVAPDHSWVRFNLNPKARFDDGTPITAEDVRYTFEQLTTHGKLQYRIQFADVARVVVESPGTVRFDFSNAGNRTLALDIATLPVLPEHWWRLHDFAQGGGFAIPPGSGPYRVAHVDPGRSLRLQRVTDWWGADLAVNRGLYNFDQLRVEYFADNGSVDVEALRAGVFDFNTVGSSAQYATAYTGDALRDGRLQKARLGPQAIQGTQGFVFNLDKPVFADRRVRQALALLWDFQWTNHTLMYDAYVRQRSFFSNSEMAATGLPDAEQLKILASWRAQLPREVFNESFAPPVTDGSGIVRDKQLQALALLEEAGWHPQGEQLVNAAGQPLRFTFLNSGTGFERLVLPFKRNLMQIGVTLDFRSVDAAQYINRLRLRDYDMIVANYPVSASPGLELFNEFGSQAANDPGSNNYLGLRDPVVDQLIAGVVKADNRQAMLANARALDRVLQWGYYWIPNFYSAGTGSVWWNRFGRPAVAPTSDTGLDTWWQVSEQPLSNAQMQALAAQPQPPEARHAGL